MKGIKQIKNYRLVKEISKGDIWTVFEGIDDTTNEIYALKTFQRSRGSKPIREKFKKDIRLLRSLSHENIVKIIGYEKTVNNVYLVLDYCNGGTLLDYFNFYMEKYKSPLPEAKVQFIMRQLINGLDFMNKNKILHRDLKPDNILLNFQVKNALSQNYVDIYQKYSFFDSSLKISDLGYLKDEENYKIGSTICGYPFYLKDNLMSKGINTNIDLHTLGKICYQLLTGISLEWNNEENQYSILNSEKCINRLEISIEAISFINGLLHNDLNKRIDWNQVVNHPFILNDTTSFKNIFLDKIPNSNIYRTQFPNVWSMFYSHMINLNIDQIEIVSIESNSKIQKQLNLKDNIDIPTKPNLILKENSKSRNNSKSSMEIENRSSLKVIEDDKKKSYDLLTGINPKELTNFEVKIENDKENNEDVTNKIESENKLSNAVLNEYINSNFNIDERWEIIFTESKCVEINNHENHYVILQDYFN